MSLLFVDSFDHYRTADIFRKWTASGLLGFSIVAPGRCAGQCLRQTAQTGFYCLKGINPGASTPNGTAGFAFKCTVNLNGANIFQVGSGVMQSNQPHFRLQLSSSDGSLNVFSYPGAGVAVWQAGSAANAIQINEWFYLEVQWAVHATTGSVIIHINDVEVLNATNICTRYLGAPATWTSVGFVGTPNCDYYLDDFYVLDDQAPGPVDFLGDQRVYCLYPTAAGATSDWTPQGSANHWDNVDDVVDPLVPAPVAIPDYDTTYNWTATVDTIETYVFTEPDLAAGTLNGLQISMLARKDDAGDRSIAPVVRHGGADSVGGNLNPSNADYVYQIAVYNTNPGTGVAWVIADVKGAAKDEFGIDLTV